MDRLHRTIEYGLGVFVPLLLTMMMFAYVLAPDYFLIFLAASVLSAVAMLIPAWNIHKLSYLGWTRYAMPRTIITCLLGIIYITEVSIFAVSMLSLFEGLSPDNPLTFGVFGVLIFGLMVTLAYNDKNKHHFEMTEKRSFNISKDKVHERIENTLKAKGHEYTLASKGMSTKFDMPAIGLMLDIKQIANNSTEVLMEIKDKANHAYAKELKIDLSID
jgi:hypothetical protein